MELLVIHPETMPQIMPGPSLQAMSPAVTGVATYQIATLWWVSSMCYSDNSGTLNKKAHLGFEDWAWDVMLGDFHLSPREGVGSI